MFKNEDGKLVEEIQQPVIKKIHDRKELEKNRQASFERLEIKRQELLGAEQEVAMFDGLIAKCDELGIIIEEPVQENKPEADVAPHVVFVVDTVKE